MDRTAQGTIISKEGEQLSIQYQDPQLSGQQTTLELNQNDPSIEWTQGQQESEINVGDNVTIKLDPLGRLRRVPIVDDTTQRRRPGWHLRTSSAGIQVASFCCATPCCPPVRIGYLPVINADRVGLQIGCT